MSEVGEFPLGTWWRVRVKTDAEMVVSATPSENTVRFYLGRGFRPMAQPLPELLEALERDPSPLLDREPALLEEVVTRCGRAKAAVVAVDERGEGRRLVLNYGHTLGHALERLDAFAGRTHGEAISVGMVFAARLSEALGRGPSGLVARHVRLLASLGLETDGGLPPAEEVLSSIRMDKKYRGGARFVRPVSSSAPHTGQHRAVGGAPAPQLGQISGGLMGS